MLLITTIDMVTGLTEADCKVLSGYTTKDKIIVLSKEGAMMPVAMFQTLSSLKCQLEIKELDTKDLFQLGYIIGRLTASVKNTEKIVILTNKEFDVDDKNIVRTDSLAGVKGVKATANKSASGKAAPSKAVASKSETAKVVASKTEANKAVASKSETAKVAASKPEAVKAAASKMSTAKPSAKDKKAATGGVLWPIIGKYSKMKPYKEFVTKNEEGLIDAITNANDAEITFKFQLQMNFGAEGVAIWEILNKNFDDIKAAVQAAK